MRRRTRPLATALALCGTTALVSGCGITHPGDLNFRKDDRLSFVSPKSRSLVKAPVHLGWKISDFQVEPPLSSAPSEQAGYFAVFLDRSPIKPGQTLAAVGKSDPFCRSEPGNCLKPTYLHTQQVYPTSKTTLTLTQVPALTTGDSTQSHSATVILLDTAGRRIGESAWQVDFRMKKNAL